MELKLACKTVEGVGTYMANPDKSQQCPRLPFLKIRPGKNRPRHLLEGDVLLLELHYVLDLLPLILVPQEMRIRICQPVQLLLRGPILIQ